MPLPVVVFPDIELWATGALRTALTARSESYTSNVFVSNRVPSPRRNRMVIVRHDGGPRLDQIRQIARLGIQVWAESEQVAGQLARLTAALLWATPDGNPVCKVTTTGPTHVPDESKESLVYFTAELITRGK